MFEQQMSQSIEAGAPDITYSGNEGPKSPQQEQQIMMAQLEQEYSRYVFEMEEQGIQPMTLRQFIEQAIAEGQMSSAQPMAPRQTAAYGGIMGLDGRRQYGFGSSLKKFVRKIIPNEVAKVAEVAAPFVAPFNPLAAGLMSGIGGFDRTGRIGSSIKSGLMNYGLGQGARYLGGAGFQTGINPMTGSGVQGAGFFSKPTGTETGIGKFLDSRKPGFVPSGNQNVRLDQQPSLYGNAAGTGDASIAETIAAGGKNTTIGGNVIKEQSKNLFGELPGQVKNLLSKAGLGNNLMTGLLVGGLGAGALMGNMTEEEQAEMDRGEGMDVEGIRTEVLTAMKDPTGEALKAIRIKYPFLGTQRSKDVSGLAYGGRIRRAEGGIMDLGGMELDYRAKGGFVPIGAKEKADDVPARLSVNEFVFTADAVRSAGGGDIDKGAEIMERVMKNLEQGGQISEDSQGLQGAREMFQTSQRLGEVL
jgi:hypothetical protein